jgi:membrane protease subunit (stomatin/prohibitin family)
MPAPYQALAQGWIDVGILDDPRKVTMDRPKIKIVVDDGHIEQIIAEKGEFDVTVEEKDGATSTFTTSPNRSVGKTE